MLFFIVICMFVRRFGSNEGFFNNFCTDADGKSIDLIASNRKKIQNNNFYYKEKINTTISIQKISSSTSKIVDKLDPASLFRKNMMGVARIKHLIATEKERVAMLKQQQ